MTSVSILFLMVLSCVLRVWYEKRAPIGRKISNVPSSRLPCEGLAIAQVYRDGCFEQSQQNGVNMFNMFVCGSGESDNSFKFTNENRHLTIDKMTSLFRWKTSGALQSSNDMLANLDNLWCEVHTTSLQLASPIYTCEFPQLASKVESINASRS